MIPPNPLGVIREERPISLLLYAQAGPLVGSLAGQMGSQGTVSSPLTLREVTIAGTLSAQGPTVSLAHKAVTIPLETMKVQSLLETPAYPRRVNSLRWILA